MGSDDDDRQDREAILRRRSRFVAIALSGLTSTLGPACGDDATADAVQQVGDNLTQQTSPQACLEQSVEMTAIEEDAGAPDEDAGDDAGGGDAGADAGAEVASPRPCLRRATPRPCLRYPRTCLSVRPPRPQPCLTPIAPQPCLELQAPPPQPCLNVELKPEAGADEPDEG